MGNLPEHLSIAPPRRLVAAGLVLFACMSGVPQSARTQTLACKDVIAQMVAQEKMIGIFRSIDYQIREHFLIEANAIMSTYGGWNSIERGNDATNATKLRDMSPEFHTRAMGFKRDVGRSKAMAAEELERANDAVANFFELIETGDRIAKALADGNVDEANQIYYAVARPAYMQVHGDLYTLIVTAERRVAALAKGPCD